uniref:NADH-ubiquinone oxidoreductase chain 3 n=1 Tax=Trogium pulsatorium TaxID=297900 RepID=A0A343QC93_9NEOP|nr:NADH dehydrogenase subunit 3 [Trogium pulsatorium]
MFLLFVFSVALSIILNFLATLLSHKTLEDQEKLSPFECGFEPLKPSRLPFSLRFFLITIVFLIFDVEIAFVLPFILNLFKTNFIWWILIVIPFIMILFLGILYEWSKGCLKWTE